MQTVPVPARSVNPYPPLVTASPAGLVVLAVHTLARNRLRTDRYFVERIECDDLAYSLRKCDPAFDGTDPETEVYAVNLTLSTCECRGWLRWGACKHLAGCREAYEEGRLP
jgi:hypothetical protein